MQAELSRVEATIAISISATTHIVIPVVAIKVAIVVVTIAIITTLIVVVVVVVVPPAPGLHGSGSFVANNPAFFGDGCIHPPTLLPEPLRWDCMSPSCYFPSRMLSETSS